MVRTVHMNSDLINSSSKDLAWLQQVGKYLDYWGVPWKAYSYESSPHVKLLKKASGDVVFLHNSLMCSGTIVDVCSNYYQQLKGTRKFLWNFYTPTEDYAFSVDFLKRAADDNFSPASFTGLNQPVRYMVQNGAFHVNSSVEARKVARRLAMLAYEK